MDLKTYNQIYHYLQTLEHKEDTTYSEQRLLTTTAYKYYIENNHLYQCITS